MKRSLHLIPVKIIILKSSYNCFKIDILRLVRSLTAIFSAVQSQGIGKIVSLQLSGKVLAIQIFAGYKLQDWGSSGRQQLSTKRDNCPNASLMVQLLMVENSNTLPWLKEMFIYTLKMLIKAYILDVVIKICGIYCVDTKFGVFYRTEKYVSVSQKQVQV